MTATDRSTHPTVVEYAVQTMIQKHYGPAAAAKDTAKRLSGHENMFLGSGITTVDPVLIEAALWDRVVDYTIRQIPKLREGKEHYALDFAVQQYSQKPSVRAKIKAAVIAKLGRNPFVSDDQPG
jgi:hypothetical protein